MFVIFILISQVLSRRPSRMLPLMGNSTLGYFYIEAEVGSSRQRQSLIVDTGSYSTIFDCAGCHLCNNHKDPIFDPSRSSTFRQLTSDQSVNGWSCIASAAGRPNQLCEFEESYLEGSSYSGFMASDVFLFANETTSKRVNKNYKHIFGCAMKETNEFFKQEANGIMGLGLRRLPNYKSPTIVEVEFAEGRSVSQGFSICLGRNGGTLRFGEPNVELHLPGEARQTISSGKLRWTDIYSVGLNGISIQNSKVDYDFSGLEENPGMAFFDSGTTYTYFSYELFDRWRSSFMEFCKKSKKNCAGMEEYADCPNLPEDLASAQQALLTFPNATFSFTGGAKYVWHAKEYFENQDGRWCIGVKPLKDVILGANFMANYDVFFDQGTQRVSFARANCSGEADIWHTIASSQEAAASVAVWMIPVGFLALINIIF